MWRAMSKLRRGRLDECVLICNEILENQPRDQVETLISNSHAYAHTNIYIYISYFLISQNFFLNNH